MKKKEFSEVAIHYRYLARDFPTNTHFCQIHNTLLAYGPLLLDGVIKAIRDHIDHKEQEIEKYRESDRIYVSECRQSIAFDQEFLEFVGVPYRGQHVLIHAGKEFEEDHKGRVTRFDGDSDGLRLWRTEGKQQVWVDFDPDDKWAGEGSWASLESLSPIEEEGREEGNG